MTTRPFAPFAVVDTVAPVSEIEAPELATTPAAATPVVEIVAPTCSALRCMATAPPLLASTATAPVPEVAIEPAENVVEPLLAVSTPKE